MVFELRRWFGCGSDTIYKRGKLMATVLVGVALKLLLV